MGIKEFGVEDQIGYVYGDMVGNFVNLCMDAFFLTLCTYVLGIKIIWMGTLSSFARLWDASSDPMIDSLPDRWQIGKSSDKFEPYTRIAMIPLAMSGLLCLTDVPSSGSVVKHVWVAVAYIFYGMSYTGTSTPYGSVASMIANDPIERTKLSRARSIDRTIMGIDGLSPVSQFIFNKVGDVVPSEFMRVAIVLSALSLSSYVLLLCPTTERVRQLGAGGQKLNYGKALGNVVKNHPMPGVMPTAVGSFLHIVGDSQLGSLLYKKYHHASQVLTLVSLISVPIMLIFFPVIPELGQKFGKRNVILFYSSYNLVTSTILFLVSIPNVHLFLVLNTLAVSGQAAFTILIWAFVADCIDYNEYQTGEKSDGGMYSVHTFSRKIGSMLASTVAPFSPGTIGHIFGIEAQTETVTHPTRYLCTDISVMACILELIGIDVVYNLTKEKINKICTELSRRRDTESRA